jgi:diketogulonate reductase-like aldo/keto reductase
MRHHQAYCVLVSQTRRILVVLSADPFPDDNTKIMPRVNQIEASVYLQWTKIVNYCHSHNPKIVVQAFSPLGHGAANVISDETVLEMAEK